MDKHPFMVQFNSIEDRMRTGLPCLDTFYGCTIIGTLLSSPASHNGLPITQDIPTLSYLLLRLLIPDLQGLSRNKYRGGPTQPRHTPHYPRTQLISVQDGAFDFC